MAKRTKRRAGGARAGRVAFGALVTLAALMLAFFLVMRNVNETSIAENALGSALAPVQQAVSSVTRYVRDLVNGVKSYNEIKTGYEAAQRDLTSMQLKLDALEEAAVENERLKLLLDAKDRQSSLSPLYAKVIARAPGVWFDTFSINRGQIDGVAVNMAVITADGLVGRVYEVGLSYAKVMSIIDTRSAVACLIERTRDNGVLRGQIDTSSETDACRMYYLPAVTDVTPGDTVLTSGVDTLFPKGITVGTVTEVSRQSDSADQYIVVAPSVDFQHIEEVLVLRVLAETDDAPLPSLPTPTPRPTPSPDPSATPSPSPTANIDDDDAVWQRPTPDPNEITIDGLPVGSTPSPSPTPFPDDMLPEDEWATAG